MTKIWCQFSEQNVAPFLHATADQTESFHPSLVAILEAHWTLTTAEQKSSQLSNAAPATSQPVRHTENSFTSKKNCSTTPWQKHQQKRLWSDAYFPRSTPTEVQKQDNLMHASLCIKRFQVRSSCELSLTTFALSQSCERMCACRVQRNHENQCLQCREGAVRSGAKPGRASPGPCHTAERSTEVLRHGGALWIFMLKIVWENWTVPVFLGSADFKWGRALSVGTFQKNTRGNVKWNPNSQECYFRLKMWKNEALLW